MDPLAISSILPVLPIKELNCHRPTPMNVCEPIGDITVSRAGPQDEQPPVLCQTQVGWPVSSKVEMSGWARWIKLGAIPEPAPCGGGQFDRCAPSSALSAPPRIARGTKRLR